MLLYLLLGGIFVLAQFGCAYLDRFAFGWQVRSRAHPPAKFLTFWQYAGMWGDFFIVNPVVAYVLDVYGRSWSGPVLSSVFTVIALAGAVLIVRLPAESHNMPSAFARDGFVTPAGAVHYIYFTVAMTVVFMFYLFTPAAGASMWEVITITILLIVHWGLSVLQPLYMVFGKIHVEARIATGIGWIVLCGLAARLIYLAR
jgi:hypothetical protein